MPSSSALIGFSLAALVLIAIPGPSVLFVIGRSLALGRRAGLLSVVGNELGALVLVIAVALGVGSIIAESIVLFTIIKIVGALYLAYLGYSAIRHRNEVAATAESAGSSSAGRALWEGAIVGATNPKSIVFFVAVLPQFVSYENGSVPLQMFILGAIFTVIALISDGIWALAAGTAREWFARSPQRMSRLRATGGGMMIALGGILLFTGNKN